eukprot:6208985-Pleurochrysis_carterae.AAC.2
MLCCGSRASMASFVNRWSARGLNDQERVVSSSLSTGRKRTRCSWSKPEDTGRPLLDSEEYATAAQRREYFYFVDLQGRLYLDETWPKGVATCLRSGKFLDFFFSRMRVNATGIREHQFPFVSMCGRERNFVRYFKTVCLLDALRMPSLVLPLHDHVRTLPSCSTPCFAPGSAHRVRPETACLIVCFPTPLATAGMIGLALLNRFDSSIGFALLILPRVICSDGVEHLVFASTRKQVFDVKKLRVCQISGRLYHQLDCEPCGFALLRSSLAEEIAASLAEGPFGKFQLAWRGENHAIKWL